MSSAICPQGFDLENLTREVREITSVGEWLRWRSTLMTASRIGALFDCDPHLTMTEIIEEMRGERRGVGDNPAMRRGRILEPAVIAAIQEEHPEWCIQKANTFHVLPDLRLGCTPDAFGDDDLLVQCKTVAPHQWEQWHGAIPLHYTLQTLTEMLVTGRTRGVLAVMICNQSFPLHLFDVPRHKMAESKILDAVADFWRRVDAGDFPIPAPKDELEALLDDGSHKDLSNDNYLPEALERRESLMATRGEAEAEIKQIEYEIKNRLGTASNGWLPGWVISYRTRPRKGYTVPAGDIRPLRIKRTEDAQE